jgi:hypothetical protein
MCLGNYRNDGVKEFKRVERYDCFNFIWLVFSNLIEQGLVSDSLEARIAGRFRTVDIVKDAIAKNILFELGEFTQFTKKSGFVYYNVSEDGFDTMFKRHCGFYIINNDKSISFIHNVNTKNKKGGTREKKFQNVREFKDYLLQFYSVYTSNSTNSVFRKSANIAIRKIRSNMGHYN